MRRETGEERGQRWRRGKYSGLVTLGEELMWAGVKLRWARRSGPGRPQACCWSGNCRAMSEWACASRAKSAVGCSHGRCSNYVAVGRETSGRHFSRVPLQRHSAWG